MEICPSTPKITPNPAKTPWYPQELAQPQRRVEFVESNNRDTVLPNARP